MWYKLSKNLDLGPNYWKISNSVKMFWKSRFWSKFFEKSQFWWKIMKISILLKIYTKFRFWSKFSKFSIMVKICKKNPTRIGSKFSIIYILVDFSKNPDLGEYFWNSWFWPKFWENPDFGQNYWKASSFGRNLRKMSFRLIFAKISILVKICEKSHSGQI